MRAEVVKFEMVVEHIPKQGNFAIGSDILRPGKVYVRCTTHFLRKRDIVVDASNNLSGTHEGIARIARILSR